MWSSKKYVNVGASKNVSIKAYRKVNKLFSKHVDIEVYDQKSMCT